MISFIRALPAGTAVQVVVSPPDGATCWRLLRKTSDTFTGEDDPQALLVAETDDLAILDAETLVNGSLYYYCAYSLMADGTWQASDTVSVTPALTIQRQSPDAFMFIRQRLDDGLRGLVAAGQLTHPQGHIRVLSAPPVFEDTVFPVVTLHLASESSAERVVGSTLLTDVAPDDDDPDYVERDGWLARSQLQVIAWAQNPDERILLRNAIRDLIVANIGIFDDTGICDVDLSQQDTEDLTSFNAPIYQSVGTLSYLAPVIVGGAFGAISQTTPAVTITEP